ncbi:hypothetical protein L7F22_054189 [Adiantum nelumboides]|nr:hypothetical protein [Adiantum nelumboides]
MEEESTRGVNPWSGHLQDKKRSEKGMKKVFEESLGDESFDEEHGLPHLRTPCSKHSEKYVPPYARVEEKSAPHLKRSERIPFLVLLFCYAVTGSMLVLVTDLRKLVSTRDSPRNWLVLRFAGNWSGLLLADSFSGSGSVIRGGSGFNFCTGSEPSVGTQGSATQDPHIAASDSSSDFDVMEGYPMQQHPESSSQDMHALGQQPGASMFSRLKETLSRATCFEYATIEINEGSGEVDSPFTSQIDPVLPKSAHVSTPATTPIGFLKPTPSETLLLDGKSLAEVQEVKHYILAAREKEIENLRKAEQHSGFDNLDSVTIYCDNISSIMLAKNPVYHARTKHIEVHFYFIREKVLVGAMDLVYVKTNDQVADIFTKALGKEKFCYFREALGIHQMQAHSEFEGEC